MRIMIAKTTHLGDVVIALPLAGVLKYYYPDSQILFLAKGPACDIARRYAFIDEVYDESIIQTEAGLTSCRADIFIQVNTSKKLALAAKKANIPVRIGSFYRYYNWSLCSHLVMISRQHKAFNKRQLDLQYLRPLGMSDNFTDKDLTFLYQFKQDVNSVSNYLPRHSRAGGNPVVLKRFTLDPRLRGDDAEGNNTFKNQERVVNPVIYQKFTLILHPSLITAKKYQWPLSYYQQLIASLDPQKFQIIITGIDSDRAYLADFLSHLDSSNVIDRVGKLNMDDFITLIQQADGLIAGSTGPLHLAAALGIHALGVYRADPQYIKRWEPVGWRAEIIAQKSRCLKCPSGDPCQCILSVKPDDVKARVLNWASTLKIHGE